MEVKKSASASLEKQRTTGFLMGLVLALALFVAAMEWNSSSDEQMVDEALFDEMASDMEMVPVLDPRDMVVAQTHPVVPTIKVNPVETVVDEVVEEPQPQAQADKGQDELPAVDPEQAQPLPSTAVAPVVVDANNNEVVLRVVQQYPEFPGGMVEFIKWLTANLQYPAPAKQRNLQGTVVTTFVVNKDGSIADVKVLRGVDPLLDKEALRVLNMMPTWSPGENEGKPCRTLVRLPIVFKI